MNYKIRLLELCDNLNDQAPPHLMFMVGVDRYYRAVDIVNEGVKVGVLKINTWGQWEWVFKISESVGWSSDTIKGWRFETKGLVPKILERAEALNLKYWREQSQSIQKTIWRALTEKELGKLVGRPVKGNSRRPEASTHFKNSGVKLVLKLRSKYNGGKYALLVEGENNNIVRIPEELPCARALIRKVKKFDQDVQILLED